jgi:hypothetical protein
VPLHAASKTVPQRAPEIVLVLFGFHGLRKF